MERVSALRKLLADARGETYHSFATLAEARAVQVAAVILEGDWGGQIYATCPVSAVRCSEARLDRLVVELESRCWGADQAEDGGASVLYEPLPAGSFVAGGMDGGFVTDTVWVHDEVRRRGLAAAVEGILLGTMDDLPPTSE